MSQHTPVDISGLPNWHAADAASASRLNALKRAAATSQKVAPSGPGQALLSDHDGLLSRQIGPATRLLLYRAVTDEDGDHNIDIQRTTWDGDTLGRVMTVKVPQL